MESSLIQKLDRCLLSSHPILFTGAGFSLGATNGNGEAIPSGNVLNNSSLKFEIMAKQLYVASQRVLW